MAGRDFLFTSESVTEGHPDKIADQVSDSVLDAVLRDDPGGRVACETLITTGLVVVAGEITTEIYVDIPKLVRERIAQIGYTHSEWGFDANTCGVVVAIDEQSPDIAQGASPDEAAKQIGMVVEGLTTAPVLRDLSHRLGIELPITEGVCAVLEGVALTDLLMQLMRREPTAE